MPKWWVFQYFPSAYEKDLQRFWPKERLFNELAGRDFTVEARMEYKMKEEKVADLIHYAQNKDISSLNLVDEHEYRQGLERMEHALKKDPAIKVVNELAEIFFLAKKK